MPTYEITILDENTEDVMNQVINDLKLKQAKNKQLNRKRSLRTLNKAYEKAMGSPLRIDFEYLKKSKTQVELIITTTAPTSEKAFDKAVKGLKAFGKMKIERIPTKELKSDAS